MSCSSDLIHDFFAQQYDDVGAVDKLFGISGGEDTLLTEQWNGSDRRFGLGENCSTGSRKGRANDARPESGCRSSTGKCGEKGGRPVQIRAD
jgi:hypothetical protein